MRVYIVRLNGIAQTIVRPCPRQAARAAVTNYGAGALIAVREEGIGGTWHRYRVTPTGKLTEVARYSA